jgi:hypothetical protein
LKCHIRLIKQSGIVSRILVPTRSILPYPDRRRHLVEHDGSDRLDNKCRTCEAIRSCLNRADRIVTYPVPGYDYKQPRSTFELGRLRSQNHNAFARAQSRRISTTLRFVPWKVKRVALWSGADVPVGASSCRQARRLDARRSITAGYCRPFCDRPLDAHQSAAGIDSSPYFSHVHQSL